MDLFPACVCARQIHVWDLKTHRLHSVIGGHGGAVSSLYFFPREPLLLSSSRDNSLRMWVFDGADGSARLLKSREGHTAPPRRIRYYGSHTLASMGSGADATGCQILSAGSDRSFRVFNTARDAQSRELSQGPLLKKARKLHVRTTPPHEATEPIHMGADCGRRVAHVLTPRPLLPFLDCPP